MKYEKNKKGEVTDFFLFLSKCRKTDSRQGAGWAIGCLGEVT